MDASRSSSPERTTFPGASAPTFRRAVDAKNGEKIVFTWQIWLDKATLEAAEARMHQDKRLEVAAEIPFDAKRLVLGCFTPVYTMDRERR